MNSIFFILAVRGWHFLCCWKFLEGGQSPQIEGSVEACPPFLVYNKINRKRVCLQTACDIDKKIHRVKLCNLSKKWFWLGGVNIFCASGYFWGVDRTLKHLKKLSQNIFFAKWVNSFGVSRRRTKHTRAFKNKYKHPPRSTNFRTLLCLGCSQLILCHSNTHHQVPNNLITITVEMSWLELSWIYSYYRRHLRMASTVPKCCFTYRAAPAHGLHYNKRVPALACDIHNKKNNNQTRRHNTTHCVLLYFRAQQDPWSHHENLPKSIKKYCVWQHVCTQHDPWSQ